MFCREQGLEMMQQLRERSSKPPLSCVDVNRVPAICTRASRWGWRLYSARTLSEKTNILESRLEISRRFSRSLSVESPPPPVICKNSTPFGQLSTNKLLPRAPHKAEIVGCLNIGTERSYLCPNPAHIAIRRGCDLSLPLILFVASSMGEEGVTAVLSVPVCSWSDFIGAHNFPRSTFHCPVRCSAGILFSLARAERKASKRH